MGKLNIITGDIVESCVNMDAIVNSQNKYMEYGSGVCGAIYRAAGTELLDYCKEKYSTPMKDYEVRITPGFNINCDIIHILAPKAYEQENPINALIDCYENLLKEIEKKNYKKVILPSLGAGIHGYKHNQIAKPIMILLNRFCENHEIQIYFVNLNTETTNIYLNEYLLIKGINIKNDLEKLKTKEEVLLYLKTIGLYNVNAKDIYNNFIDGKMIEEMNKYEKIVSLQYTIENYNIPLEKINPLLNEM